MKGHHSGQGSDWAGQYLILFTAMKIAVTMQGMALAISVNLPATDTTGNNAI
jgi:hypothetical protein